MYLFLFNSQVATAGFVTEEKAVEIEKFFKDNPVAVADRIIKRSCEDIRLNAKWLERDSKAVEDWLKSRWLKFWVMKRKQLLVIEIWNFYLGVHLLEVVV